MKRHQAVTAESLRGILLELKDGHPQLLPTVCLRGLGAGPGCKFLDCRTGPTWPKGGVGEKPSLAGKSRSSIPIRSASESLYTFAVFKLSVRPHLKLPHSVAFQ